MERGKLTLSTSLASAFTVALVLALRASGDWRGAVVVGGVSAGQAAASGAFLDQLMASFIPRVHARAAAAVKGSGLEAPVSSMGSTPPDLSGGGLPPAIGGGAPGDAACEGPACQAFLDQAAAAAAMGGGSLEELAAAAAKLTDAEKEEALRLALVQMKARGKGDTRNYGYKDSKRQTAVSGPPPDSSAFEASFGGMIQKLKNRAAAAAPTGLGGGKEGEGSGSGEEGESPILTKNGIDPKYNSPTLNALQKVNANGAHALKMGSDPGLEDGSRDHAGKSFDGNLNTFMDIPIEVKKGAMGQSTITVGED
ncbi:MAG: hypothetical protein HYZ75_13805 [Elusimicrobia bacterium]|nr:hypothetical protein [Elusimicrobiota bacterium]